MGLAGPMQIPVFVLAFSCRRPASDFGQLESGLANPASVTFRLDSAAGGTQSRRLAIDFLVRPPRGSQGYLCLSSVGLGERGGTGLWVEAGQIPSTTQ